MLEHMKLITSLLVTARSISKSLILYQRAFENDLQCPILLEITS